MPACGYKVKWHPFSETDARDVYSHGNLVKPNMMVRKYHGYEMGIWLKPHHNLLVPCQEGWCSDWFEIVEKLANRRRRHHATKENH